MSEPCDPKYLDVVNKENRMQIREYFAEIDEEFLFADGFDEAVIGYVSVFGRQNVILYDREKVIQILMADGMSSDDTEDYFEFNIQGAYVGESTPAFATLLPKA